MVDTDLNVDIDFDSLLDDNQPQKQTKKRNSSKNFNIQESKLEVRGIHNTTEKKINKISSKSITISMNFNQIHLDLEYFQNENDKTFPSIIEILSELKEKL